MIILSYYRKGSYTVDQWAFVVETKTSLRDIPIPDNHVKDLKRNRGWFTLADDNFDEKQDEYYLAVGLGKQPLYPPR